MNVLVINMTRLGDLLQSQPTVADLKAQGHRVGLACLDNFAPAAALMQGLDGLFPIPGARLLARLDRQGTLDLDCFRRELNAELSCKAAIKKHHHLPAELAQRLIEDLMACAVPHTCPHGRPVIKKLTLGELERSFGRRV